MTTRQQMIWQVLVQFLILGYALYANWNPFTLFLVYVADILIGVLLGAALCIKQGGLKWVPWAAISTLFVGGVVGGLLFAAVNILVLDDLARSSLTLMMFLGIVAASTLSSWPGILLNSVMTARAVYIKRNQDIFFLPLYPLTRLVPLFPVMIFGGFIALIGLPQAVIVGMTLAHLGTDLFFLFLRRSEAKLQTLVANHAPKDGAIRINLHQ